MPDLNGLVTVKVETGSIIKLGLMITAVVVIFFLSKKAIQ